MPPRPFPSFLARLTAALACAVALGGAWAQESAPANPAFDLVVRAPDDVRELLERHLALKRYREVPDLVTGEILRWAKSD